MEKKIKIPWCFYCNHFDGKDKQTGIYRCAAFPDGMPDRTLSKIPSKGQECAMGYHYEGELEKYL